jgi:hypothetical protein
MREIGQMKHFCELFDRVFNEDLVFPFLNEME